MGKFTVPFDLSNVEDPKDFMRFVSQFVKQCAQLIGGKLTWGENMQGAIVDVTFTAGSTPTQVQHGLGYVPRGFHQIGASTDVLVYGLPSSDWNGDAISLQSNKAGTVKLIIF